MKITETHLIIAALVALGTLLYVTRAGRVAMAIAANNLANVTHPAGGGSGR